MGELRCADRWLDGKRIDMPPVRQTSVTYKRAPKATAKAAEQPRIFGNEGDDPTF